MTKSEEAGNRFANGARRRRDRARMRSLGLPCAICGGAIAQGAKNQHHAEPRGTILHRFSCDTYRLRDMREPMGGARCRSETHAAAPAVTRSSAACVRSASRAGYAGFQSTRRFQQGTRWHSSLTSWCP